MLLSVFLFGEVTVSSSGIKDNHSRGYVGDFLKEIAVLGGKHEETKNLNHQHP
jgi:hypothetical protein